MEETIPKTGEVNYADYRQAFTLTEEAFLRQRRELGRGAPLLSIVVEGCWPGLKEALAEQSCLRFEVLTAEIYGLPGERVLPGTTLHERAGCSRGLEIAFLPEGALPAQEWVYHLIKSLLAGVDMVYTDEEILTDSGAYVPDFKPGFGMHSLLGRNILGRSVAVSRVLYHRCGGYREQTPEGWYDFILRSAELAGRVEHIPLVLLRLREGQPPQQTWPVEQAIARQGLQGVVGAGEIPGTFQPRFFVGGMPFVSLLVRASEGLQPLKTLLEWVEKRSVYANFEWVISCPVKAHEEMEAYLQALKRVGAARIFREQGTTGECLNRCARRARGEYLLFMEEGCLPLTANFIGRLLEWAMLPKTGVVGGRRCLGQGLTLLPERLPGRRPVALNKENWQWTEVVRNVSCLPLGGAMVKKERFWAGGGFESLSVRYMEALSLTLGRQGYGAVYCPDARFAVPMPAEAIPLDSRGREIFHALLWEGDPLFNPNLSMTHGRLHLALPPLPPGEEGRE